MINDLASSFALLRAAGSAALLAVGLTFGAPGAGVAQTQTITFAEILASPDDAQLNLDYARQEVAGGRLQQAAAALERMLLLRPNWDSVRLFYGIVLYRLNDLESAKRELTLLEGRGLSASQERNRVRYLDLATKQSDPLRFSARYTLGMRLDSNPGRSPENSALAPVVGNEGADVAITAASRFRAEADIGTGQGDYVFFQSNAFNNEFFEADTADLIATRSKIGLVFHGPEVIVSPYLLYGSSWLQHERFRQQLGGGVNTDWTLTSQLSLWLNARAAYENYEVTSYSTVGSARDGWRKSVNAGLKFRPTDRQIFRFDGSLARKDANNDGFSYDQGMIRARSLTLFGDGIFLALTGSYTHTQYDQPDNFLSPTITREDDRFYGRAAVGAPLETLFASFDVELPESISDIVAQVGVSYTKQNSSIQRLDHNNWSGDILFTKRISF